MSGGHVSDPRRPGSPPAFTPGKPPVAFTSASRPGVPPPNYRPQAQPAQPRLIQAKPTPPRFAPPPLVQNPASVWIALRQGARTPALNSPSLRLVRLSGPSLTEGVENHRIEGVPVRVYSAAKTVADCFKFRNKIGLDVAIEALKDSLRQKKASINEIHRYAKICRVSNVIRPYLESLV